MTLVSGKIAEVLDSKTPSLSHTSEKRAFEEAFLEIAPSPVKIEKCTNGISDEIRSLLKVLKF